MKLRTITVGRVIAAVIATYASAGLFIAHLACESPAVIGNRHGIRAVIMMPAELRRFPVDRHLGPGETCVYTLSTVRKELTRWRLSIDSTPQRCEHWRDTVAGYLEQYGFRSMGPLRYTGRRRNMRFRTADGRYATFDSERSAAPGRIHMNLDYWPDLNRRGRKNAVAILRTYVYRIKRSVFGTNVPFNTITGPT